MDVRARTLTALVTFRRDHVTLDFFTPPLRYDHSTVPTLEKLRIHSQIHFIYITFKEHNSELQTSGIITSIITFVILKDRDIFHTYRILSLSGSYR